MALHSYLISRWTVSLVVMLYLVADAVYETDEKLLIEMFRNLHIDDKLLWPEINPDVFQPSTLNRICNNVVDQLRNTRIDQKKFKKVRQSELQKKRVIRGALVHFEDGLRRMPLLKCIYGNKTLYLADGDCMSVFLMKDNGDDTYRFESGTYVVVYALPCGREADLNEDVVDEIQLNLK